MGNALKKKNLTFAKCSWHEVQIKALQGGDNLARRVSRASLLAHDRAEEVGRGAPTIKFDFGEVGADCLMLNRIVADGMAVEANQHFTVALDLKITDELRRACVARELVNRIQNRRKDQDYAITDKIEVTLFSASDVFKQAVAENEAYIAGETQAVKIAWAASADGLEANEADGEAFAFTTVKA